MADRTLLAAFAHPVAGPGWSNRPVIAVFYENGVPVVEYIQPEEQSAEMLHIYDMCAAAHLAMTRAVAVHLGVRW